LSHFCQVVIVCILFCVQTVSSHKLKMLDCSKQLSWTALPEPCRKCFGVNRKRVRTENATSKRELLPKVTVVEMNTQHTGGEDCSSDPVLSTTSLILTEDMLLSAGCSSVVCPSLKTVTMSAASAKTTPSGSQNMNYSSNMKPQNNGLYSVSKAPQVGFVRPLFQSSVFKFDSQTCVKEADSRCCAASDTKVTAARNMNKDLDLHRCPLCDTVFDIR